MKFVVQKHKAKRLHYDLRLQMKGTYKSWAIPKGIPRTPGVKRLAIRTSDHSSTCAHFEGTIHEGYGKGTVEIYDKGTYTMTGSIRKGELHIHLSGKKLRGSYALVHMDEDRWLIIKSKTP